MPIVPPEQELPPGISPLLPPCDCPGSRSQPFTPKFESLSDDDLDICEIIALSLLAGASELTWDTMQYAFTLTKCCACMTKRQRREFEIWWVLYLAGCTTSDEMYRLIKTINSKTTSDQRAGALTCLRTYVWDYADCGDLI